MKLLATGLLALFILVTPLTSFAQEMNAQVQADLAQVLQIIVRAVNEDTPDTILDGISENAAPTLKEEIRKTLEENEIELSLSTKTITANDDGTYTVKGVFSAEGISSSGINWSLDGIPNEFTFERANESWWLLDTNFHERIGASYTFKFIGTVFGVLALLFLIIFTIVKRKKQSYQSPTSSSSLPDNL